MTQVGQYRLLDKLGSSVLGAVYQAQDMATGSTVALKVLQLGMLDDVSSADMDTRLQREFAAVARLIHPGIARVYDIRRDGKTALIAEELVDESAAAVRFAGSRNRRRPCRRALRTR